MKFKIYEQEFMKFKKIEININFYYLLLKN